MAEINNVIAEASQDLQTIEDFVNLPAGSDVRPRLLPSVNVGTLAGTRDAIFEAGGLPAVPFATKALMTASALVDGKYAQVTDDTVNNGLYVKTAGAWVKSIYDPVSMANIYSEKQRKLGENNVSMMRPTSPYYEKVGTSLYFKFRPDAGGGCFSVYDKRYPTTRITLTQFETMMETIPLVKRGVTSPSGVEGCYRLADVECIVFNHDTRELEYRTSVAEVGNFTVIVANSYSGISSCTEEFHIRQQMLNADINKSFASKSFVTSSVNHGSNAITNMWFVDPHYEMYNNLLYFKPSTYLSTGYCFYVRDARYSSHAISLEDFYTQLQESGMPESRFKITSPSGVEDCVVLAVTSCIFYDIDTKRLIWGDRSIKGNYVLLVGNDSGQVAKSLEEPMVYNKLLQSRINTIEASIPDSSIVKNEKDAYIKAVAHRGYSTVAPENTLPAYALAKKMGFYYVECDVLFSSDDVPVIHHDESINRTSNGTGKVAEMTLAQLKTYDFGVKKGAKYTGTKIPTLKELLQLCFKLNLHVYLEVKPYDSINKAGRVDTIINTVKMCGMEGRVSYIGSAGVLGLFKVADPNARLGNVTLASSAAIDSTVSLKTATNSVFLNAERTTVTQLLMDEARGKGVPIEVWTVNAASEVSPLASLGVTGIATDILNIRQILNDDAGV